MATLSDTNLYERLRPHVVAVWRWLTAQNGHGEDGDSATPIRRRPGVDFSLTGLIYCAMMLFMGLAAITSQANLLFAVFGLMIGILLISAMICRLVLMRLHVERVIPESTCVGQPATIRYDFLNAKQLLAQPVGLSCGAGRGGGFHAAAARLHASRRRGKIGASADYRDSQAPWKAQAQQLPDQHEFPVRIREAGDDGRSGRYDPDLSGDGRSEPAVCWRFASRRSAAGRT